MPLDFGDADAGVAVATSIIDDFIQELVRLGKIPTEYSFDRSVAPTEPLGDILGPILGGTLPPVLNFRVTLDPPPRFEFVDPSSGDPYTRLVLKGTIEMRLSSADPTSPPLQTFPLNAKAKLGLVLVPGPTVPAVGLRYQGTDGEPDAPVTSKDIDMVFESEDIKRILEDTTMDLAGAMVLGLNQSRFDEANRPPDTDWSVVLTLLPGASGTDDCFMVTVGPPGTSAEPQFTKSWLKTKTGMGVAFSRDFLDLMLDRGAKAKIGETVEGGATVIDLAIKMGNAAIDVKGHVSKEVAWGALPNVDVRFNGPLIPSLVRGTTAIALDSKYLNVDVDDEDEVFYEVLKWLVTVGSTALFFTGIGSLAAVGILSWLTLVQAVWNGDADIENAPNAVRDSLGTALGAELSVLAEALDDDTTVPPLKVDATPDSLEVVDGNMLLYAQLLIVALEEMMRLAEYSSPLKRFGIFELKDGRRFRAQELARLMQQGKITVPGFNDVNGNYVRANRDNEAANNLLEMFKSYETNEVVVP